MPLVVPIGCNTRPRGRPYCRIYHDRPSELSYLSWGRRRYGDSPIPESGHEGWHYFIVLAGATEVKIQGQKHSARPGFVSVADPFCPLGHAGTPGGECEMLTWIWRSPPHHSVLLPPQGDFRLFEADPRLLRTLRRIHARCRKAVALANEEGMLELLAARLELDLALVRGVERNKPADGRFRFDLAFEYLRNHLDELDPVRRLSEYLQISETSLKRLFHRHTGMTPRAFAVEWRMRWARERLSAEGESVKAVAYALGYRHPNDFSRAFKRYHGSTARAAQESKADAA